MNNKQRRFLPAVLATILCCTLIWGCKKAEGDNQNLNPDDQKPFDFMSTKEGSYWVYGSRDSANGTFTRYARNHDSVKNNLKYSYYQRQGIGSQDFSPEYFGRNGDKYITLLDLDGTETNYLEYVYYIDGYKQGATFTNIGKVASPVGDVTIKLSSEVSEDSLTITMNGHTYTNVIHVHSNGTAGFFAVKIGTLDSWFLKGVGILKEEWNIDILGQYKLQHQDSLMDYHVEP